MGGQYAPIAVSASRPSSDAAKHDAAFAAAVDVKVRARLLPVLFAGALFCYLDRTNLSFAALDMNAEIGLDDRAYGVGAGIFFTTYACFGVPAAVATKKFGARIGLSVILVLWGIASGAMAFISDASGFYALRLVIGATEAGFFPSVIYYLTLWADQADMGLNYTLVILATALSGIIGGPLAGVILTYTNGAAGLSGWRWLFIAEAAPTVLLGFFMLYYLDRDPANARFLTRDEREFLVERQRRQRGSRENGANAAEGMGAAIRLRWLWILIAVWLLYSCGYYGESLLFWRGRRKNIALSCD